jgi:L-alanine-DL-glutamate epimerase-like enolase superfamily enzyme
MADLQNKIRNPKDIDIVRDWKHTDAIFRIDANCGWGVEETIKNAISLKKLGVEFLSNLWKRIKDTKKYISILSCLS